ncbi:MAG: DUF2726 domain-containing protein [Amphritea sp.]|nr:DUF2726 domain-containing protein [Amphritea sp.]
MDALLLPLLVLVALFIFAGFLKKSKSATQSDDTPEHGYRKKGPLFTPAERSFYGVLLQAVDQEKYQVFGKVRVADLLEPQPSRNRSQWQKAFNAISSKHFDFVLCKIDDLTPVAVIELDDKSHNQKHRQKRDELLKKICKQTDLPMIQIPAKWAYKTEALKMMLVKEIDGEKMPEKAVFQSKK